MRPRDFLKVWNIEACVTPTIFLFLKVFFCICALNGRVRQKKHSDLSAYVNGHVICTVLTLVPPPDINAMGPKHQSYKVRLQTLAIAQQIKNNTSIEHLEGMYCTCWCDNQRDCDTNIPGPSSLVRDILGPDSDQRDELGIVREDTPEILGPSLGACVDDGLSDLDKLSDEEVVEISKLQQFSWALQEAQRRAILLENEKAKAKRKTPKTYLGNSKATIARHEKACQALVSHGFHNVFSFLALKEKEKLARRRDLEGGELADCPSVRVVEASVADQVRYGDTSSNVGTWSAVDMAHHSSPEDVEQDLGRGD